MQMSGNRFILVMHFHAYRKLWWFTLSGDNVNGKQCRRIRQTNIDIPSGLPCHRAFICRRDYPQFIQSSMLRTVHTGMCLILVQIELGQTSICNFYSGKAESITQNLKDLYL